jgi:hypothetical protein
LDATLALATIGAVTGTASTASQVFTTWRDRPRIVLNFGITTSVTHRPVVWVEVTNTGHRPTTVRQVGFYANKQRFQTYREGKPHLYGEGEVTFAAAESVFLEAGQSKRFASTPDPLAWGLHVDFPLRLYAIDIQGRRIWGAAAPVIRMLFGDDSPLQDDDPDDVKRAFEPLDRPLYPTKVEPGWKLWKKRELRRPETWKP